MAGHERHVGFDVSHGRLTANGDTTMDHRATVQGTTKTNSKARLPPSLLTANHKLCASLKAFRVSKCETWRQFLPIASAHECHPAASLVMVVAMRRTAVYSLGISSRRLFGRNVGKALMLQATKMAEVGLSCRLWSSTGISTEAVFVDHGQTHRALPTALLCPQCCICSLVP